LLYVNIRQEILGQGYEHLVFSDNHLGTADNLVFSDNHLGTADNDDGALIIHLTTLILAPSSPLSTNRGLLPLQKH